MSLYFPYNHKIKTKLARGQTIKNSYSITEYLLLKWQGNQAAENNGSQVA